MDGAWRVENTWDAGLASVDDELARRLATRVAPLRSVAAVGEGGLRVLRLLARRGSHSSSDPDDGYRNVGMQGESDAPDDMVWEENVELVEAMEMGRGLEARRVGCDICGTAN